MFYDMGAISTTATIVGKHVTLRYSKFVCIHVCTLAVCFVRMCICVYVCACVIVRMCSYVCIDEVITWAFIV